MKYFKCYLAISLIIISFNIFASEYYCPELPIKNKIGTMTKEKWLIWPLNETINLTNKYYYKFFGEIYTIKYWTAFPSGKRTGSLNENKYYIGCCYLIKDERRRVCAFKNINESKCKPILPSAPPVKFVCENNLKEKMKNKIIYILFVIGLFSVPTCFSFVGGGGSGGSHGSGSSRSSSHGYSSSSRSDGHHHEYYYSENDLHPDSILDVLGLFALCLIIVLAGKKYMLDSSIFNIKTNTKSNEKKDRIKYLKSCKYTPAKNINDIGNDDKNIVLTNLYEKFCHKVNNNSCFVDLGHEELINSLKNIFN